jgi:hypothetical protein
MVDQWNRTGSYGSNRYPWFLFAIGIVALSKGVRIIIKDKNGGRKVNIMFPMILPVLGYRPTQIA